MKKPVMEQAIHMEVKMSSYEKVVHFKEDYKSEEMFCGFPKDKLRKDDETVSLDSLRSESYPHFVGSQYDCPDCVKRWNEHYGLYLDIPRRERAEMILKRLLEGIYQSCYGAYGIPSGHQAPDFEKEVKIIINALAPVESMEDKIA